MRDVLATSLPYITAALTLTGALYLVTALWPDVFMRYFALGREQWGDSARRKAWITTKGWILLLSIGVFFYHGAKGIFAIVPWDWTYVTEDGDSASTRVLLQGIFAIVCTICVLSETEKKVALLHEREQDARRKRGD